MALVVAPNAAGAQALDLVCRGTAISNETSQTYGSAQSGGEYASGSATTIRKVRSEETLRVRIDATGSTGKVKLPRALIPLISSGKEGWWDFVKLEVTDDAIRGQVSLNVLNRPRLIIDRRTGDADVKALGSSFSGSCEKAPELPEERRF